MFYNMLSYSAGPGLNMVLFSDKEAHPLTVWEPVVVELVVSQAAPEEACIREPVREEQVIPHASTSIVGRVVGGFLSATGHIVTLLTRIAPGESLPPCRGLWGTLHTGDDVDCNNCLLWEC